MKSTLEEDEQPRTSDAAPAMTKQLAAEKLRDASWGGNVDTVRELLATAHQTGLDFNAQDSIGWSALHWACNGRRDEIVRMLLATPRININISDNNGYSPLHLACSGGHLSTVQILLERDDELVLVAAGANVNAIDHDGATPLHDACCRGKLAAVEVLLQSEAINVNARTIDRIKSP